MDQSYYEITLPHESPNWRQKKQLLQNISQSKDLTISKLEAQLNDAYHEPIILQNLLAFSNQLKKIEQAELFDTTIPLIANFALQIEELFTKKRIKILHQQLVDNNILTKLEVSCILANMFFFTIDQQPNSTSSKSKLINQFEDNFGQSKKFQLPSFVNMKNIMTRVDGELENQCNIQKIYCIINYFKRMINMSPAEKQLKIIYQRTHINEKNFINQLNSEQSTSLNSKSIFMPMEIDGERGIQDYEDQFECIQCDFADKYVGGGVLNKGCVQEEIMYIVSMELIPSILFCERLADNEVLQVTGAERYCTYKGYGPTFQYDNNYFSKAGVNNQLQIKQTHYAIFDAINFRNREMDQYKWELVSRDLMKSYAAFNHIGDILVKDNWVTQNDLTSTLDSKLENENKQVDDKGVIKVDKQENISKYLPVITGNWGCGLYKGDVQLKLMIQWISASLLGKKTYFCTFGNPLLQKAKEVVLLITSQSIQEIIKVIKNYLPHHEEESDLFSYLLAHCKSVGN